MYEKVNPRHPDKIADRIAGALVDLAYNEKENPHVAVEVLIGHGECHIINETDTPLGERCVLDAVNRIIRCENISVHYREVKQDFFLNDAQKCETVCGDNGIFRGRPVTDEQNELAKIASAIYGMRMEDGKYIFDKNDNRLIICQSNMKDDNYYELDRWLNGYELTINPLGDWIGGTDVDTGATNRKLGSDMGDSVTGGGLHGKDLSKADVSVNVYLHKLAQETGKPCFAYCAIGDTKVNVNNVSTPYDVIVKSASEYIKNIGGFERLAEWGLIRP